ncbi:TldD/PmbA family protein [Thiocystis violascens]|uniref:Putative Zn-dependent protease-like protein n=1 Tax=Thiocystis violascens (strain ATCC 17096 / DSM 198 / 6111) TaxID=765911 RepID=I3Y6E9_THIV6|nr:metallopeptidase TldD-related protein [Thiocystis violascens]AFL72567.1 putative Zn-dependent protease-like protein [Thiocystis violascens DSM 198]
MNQDTFFALADRLQAGLAGTEILFCNLGAEASDFVRLNRNRIRQAGHVRSAALGLNLIDGARQAEGRCDLTGDARQDLVRARHLLARLRERLVHVPDDPYLHYSTEASESHRQVGEAIPSAEETVAELIAAAEGLDLVGIWASGAIDEGLASSLGHRHWHQSLSFNLDWSCYLEADKAVKAGLGGFHWDTAALNHKLDALREGLRIMARPARTLDPGRYRAYLAPAAVNELTDMLAWGGFDLKSHRTHQTPLLLMTRGERRFDPRVTLREEHARGLAAGFTAEGFVKPDRVTLIEGGIFSQCLVDARDGKEYGETVNAASGSPESLGFDAGELPMAEVLARLDTGLYIGNLWYCNWSDPNDCRATGMTRFGTYWVENGEIVSPVKVMRFDDSLYHLLGDRLEGLTRERELILSAQTYDGRSTDSALLPGLLVSGINLAL